VDEQTLVFAKKLTGAWQTVDKEMTWFFDKPDELKYPHWICQVKYSLFDKFDKHNFFLKEFPQFIDFICLTHGQVKCFMF
jgi:hypothetical protein